MDEIQTFVFMDFEVAGQLLETEFSGELQPRNAYGLDQTDFLQRLITQGFHFYLKIKNLKKVGFYPNFGKKRKSKKLFCVLSRD